MNDITISTSPFVCHSHLLACCCCCCCCFLLSPLRFFFLLLLFLLFLLFSCTRSHCALGIFHFTTINSNTLKHREYQNVFRTTKIAQRIVSYAIADKWEIIFTIFKRNLQENMRTHTYIPAVWMQQHLNEARHKWERWEWVSERDTHTHSVCETKS